MILGRLLGRQITRGDVAVAALDKFVISHIIKWCKTASVLSFDPTLTTDIVKKERSQNTTLTPPLRSSDMHPMSHLAVRRRKMSHKFTRSLFTMLALVIIAASLFACAAPAQQPAAPAAAEPTAAPAAAEPTAAPAAGGEKIKVGLSFSDFATERWKNEQV